MNLPFCRRTIVAIVAAFLGLSWPQVPAASAADAKVLVFAAASLKTALDAAVAAFAAKTGGQVTVSYAGSSALAKQIEAGAPADVFISADLDWMDHVAKANLIKADTRTNLLGNTLVLVAPKDSGIAVDLTPGVDLSAALGDGKLAMADVKAVPAGKYGKAALEKLGAWPMVT